MNQDNPQSNEDDFASLFESSYSDMESMEPGQSIETEILSISGDYIFLQLNGKSEGLLDAAEMTDRDGNLTVQEGDTIKVFFLSSQNGEMVFTTRISGDKAGRNVLENAFRNGIPVEGVVEKEIKGGFDIRIGETRAFCPYSQMGSRRVEDADSYLGMHLRFKITEYSENGRNILVSNRAILEEEKKERIEALKATLHQDMVVTGQIVKIQDFGAFVDIGGFQALLPVSEISRSRVDDIQKTLSVGQEIEASVLNIDWKKERISLSMKALIADPWKTVREKYKVGQTYVGDVARITNFGAFVTLEPGLDGLVHVSEFSGDSRDGYADNTPRKGQQVTVLIDKIDAGKKRISLKLASSVFQDQENRKYLEPEEEVYNPFAALLNDEKGESGAK